MPSEMIERVARAMLDVMATPPASLLGSLELPVLAGDPDFNDLPRNGDEGTIDDEITQEAVIRLARAAIEAMRIPTFEMLCEASNITISRTGNDETNSDYDLYPDECKCVWQTMIDEALKA